MKIGRVVGGFRWESGVAMAMDRDGDRWRQMATGMATVGWLTGAKNWLVTFGTFVAYLLAL